VQMAVPDQLMLRVIQGIHGIVGMCNAGPWFGDGGMAQTVCVVLSAAAREQLSAIVADRNRPRKHVEPARIGSGVAILAYLASPVPPARAIPPSHAVCAA
jgi:hypothetical protein